MVVGSVGRHEFSLFTGEDVEKIMVLTGNDFGNQFIFIRWQWLGVEGHCWGRVIPNCLKIGGSQGHCAQFEVEGKDILAGVQEILKGRCPD